jgi:spore coat protein A
MLNGCTTRSLVLGLSNAANFQQLGTEGGLLPAPVTTNSITLAPGERADVVLDFASYTTGTQLILKNSAPDAGTVTNVMKFIVGASAGHTGAIPGTLRPLTSLSESNSVRSRNFILRKMNGPCSGTMWAINDLMFEDITEYPILDTIEVWNFVNPSGVMHPMHMHLVMFQVLDRQACTVTGTNITTSGPRIPASPTESGWKDTVQCPPGMVTRVIARFDDYTGLYPYHCHILEHEENEMMRQFQVVPPPRVTGIQPYGADIQISFSPSTNHLHSAERRDDLLTGSWSSFTNGIPGNAAIKTVTDPGAMGVTQRFYRIGVQP